MSIPRLELTAAAIGARAIHFVQCALKQTTFEKSYLWTDSKCVLSWLKSIKILPIFVQRRVNEIKKLVCNFRYVPSAQNPADIASRGCSVSELQDSIWWSARAWLSKNENNWPSKLESPEKEIEEEIHNETKTLLNNENDENEPLPPQTPYCMDINNYPSLLELLKTTALCTVAIKLFKGERIINKKELDLEDAEIRWIKYEQCTNYTDLRKKSITY